MKKRCLTCEGTLTEGQCPRCSDPGASVLIKLPSRWTSRSAGLPEMSADREGPAWVATCEDYSLRVAWTVLGAQYICEAKKGTSAVETRFLAYPHEVLEWISSWFAKVQE